MKHFTQRWKRTPGAVRKPLIFVFGFIVVGAGIAMLVLPGPGWAAIFLGFAILATEFTFAEKTRDRLIKELKRVIALLLQVWKRIWPPFKHRESNSKHKQ